MVAKTSFTPHFYYYLPLDLCACCSRSSLFTLSFSSVIGVCKARLALELFILVAAVP
jgi:hypothetical protein